MEAEGYAAALIPTAVANQPCTRAGSGRVTRLCRFHSSEPFGNKFHVSVVEAVNKPASLTRHSITVHLFDRPMQPFHELSAPQSPNFVHWL
jgi:hypothetical protein